MGRKESPSQDELEFIFSRMADGMQVSEIVEDYQDSLFPPRETRFVAEKRKYYDAARKVLEDRVRIEQDPLVSEARRRHFEDLCDLISGLEDEVTSVSRASKKYFQGVNCPDPESGATISGVMLLSKHRGTVRYTGTGEWEVGEVSLEVESQPLYECLQSHLGRDQVWSLLDDWKKRLSVMMQHELHDEITTGDYPDETYHGSIPSFRDWYTLFTLQQHTANKLLKALSIARHRRVFDGRCDACP